jgi:hopanoid biosynthesis associated RND transporter like protein HpnN
MSNSTDSIAVRLLRLLARGVFRYPRLFFFPQIVLLGLAVYYTITHLQFSTSRNDLVGSDKKYHQNYLRFKKEFPGQDDIVAVVESENPEKNRQFVERLGAKLQAETNLFGEVMFNNDLKMLGRKALLFLDEESLGEFQSKLRDYRPFVSQFAKATNLNSIFALINQQFRTARRESNAENASLVRALPALRRIVDQADDSLKRSGTPPSPGITALFDPNQESADRIYITSGKGRIYIVDAKAKSEDLNEQAVERLRQLVKETEAEVPGLNVGVTGEPVLESDEMKQSQRDSTVATILSLIVCALIFIFSYNETARPIKATLALIIGLGYTIGYTTLAVGHLNILTITFFPILIGLAIDYGVHLITRFEEELRKGKSKEEAMEKAMVNTGLGIVTGCLTTAAAFYAMAFTNFKGIQEMGIITGGGMVICLIPMMTFLPVLLMRGGHDEKTAHASKEDATPAMRARIERYWLERPVQVIALTIAICALCLTQFHKVFFDYNLLHMQSKGLPAVMFERKLIDSSAKSVLFAAVVATNAQEAVELERRITNLTTVASVDMMGQFLTGDPQSKLAKVTEIKKDVSTIHFQEIDLSPVNIPELSLTLFGLKGYLGLAIDTVEKEGDKELSKELTLLRKSIDKLRFDMLNKESHLVSTQLAAYQQALFEDLRETFSALANQDDSGPLQVQDLPSALRERFIGITGKQLLQVYPKSNVWERAEQEKFVQQLRTVDPDVTGTPVQLYEYTSLLKNSYIQASYYALGAIIIMVLIHFRSLSCVVLALLPVVIGVVWTAGAMGLMHIPFNPANIMTLPLVIGIGVTNGIHILNRFAEEVSPTFLSKSTGKAVLVSALTTIAGFGSLIPAKHQGIASLGIVMSAGIATCMIASLTFLPALLTLLIRRGWTISNNKKPSGDNAQSTLGREEPR